MTLKLKLIFNIFDIKIKTDLIYFDIRIETNLIYFDIKIAKTFEHNYCEMGTYLLSHLKLKNGLNYYIIKL